MSQAHAPATPVFEPIPQSPQGLRIVIAADTFVPDINGAARFAQRLAEGLAGRGNDVHVVCPSTTGSSRGGVVDSRGVTVHRIASLRTPFHPTFRVCTPWRAKAAVGHILDGIRPDVVHSQAHFAVGRAVVEQAAARGIPVVATNHFMPENLLGYVPLPQPVARAAVCAAWRDLARVFARADVVTAPTERAVDLMRRNGFRGAARAVSCGVDVERYACLAPEAGPEPTVLFVGRLDEEKRVDELINAVARIPADVAMRAEIVGDGSCRARLQTLAARLGVADRVRFRGFVSEFELLDAYARADVFCMPGVAELQSLATMEAMAAGTPVVAADAVALPHLVRDNENGWLFAPGDVADLAAKLARLLDDPVLRMRMGRAAKRMIAEHAMERTLREFEGIYHGLLPVRSAASTSRAVSSADVPAAA